MRLAVHVDWTSSGRASRELRRLGASGHFSEIVKSSEDVALGLLTPSIDDGGRTTSSPAAQMHGIAVVADARIDNIDDLRAALDVGSDVSLGELLIRSYLAWGDSFPDQLAGDFAIVLWDSRCRRLLAVRDPFGVRSLVYRMSVHGTWIASSVEQILATIESRPSLDDQMISEYLLWRHTSPDATFFREIRRVPPGHTFSVGSSGSRMRRYWMPPDEGTFPKGTTHQECLEEFRRLFISAVARRSPSSSPVVIHVSGGLDSSSIAVAANSLALVGGFSAPSIRGVGGIYKGLACDEQRFIHAVAQKVGFPIDLWDATDSDPADLTDPALECPGGRISQVGGTLGDVEIAARFGSQVILSGVGGDQLTTPSGVVQDMISNRDWLGAIRELFFFPDATMRSRLARVRYVAEHSAPEIIRRRLLSRREERPDWLDPGLESSVAASRSAAVSGIEFSSALQRHIWENISDQQVVRSLEALLRQVGSLAMEFRFPFLDRDLVRFVICIPYQYWPRPGPYARFHRAVFEDLLPSEVSGRFGKAEFTPALVNRVRRAESLIRGLLYEGEWACGRYVNRLGAQQLWSSVAQGNIDRPWVGWWRVWAISTLEAWMRAILRYHPPHLEAKS